MRGTCDGRSRWGIRRSCERPEFCEDIWRGVARLVADTTSLDVMQMYDWQASKKSYIFGVVSIESGLTDDGDHTGFRGAMVHRRCRNKPKLDGRHPVANRRLPAMCGRRVVQRLSRFNVSSPSSTAAQTPDTAIRTLLLRILDIVARPICQDGARNNVKEMIPPWRECGLANGPAERRHQGEQVNPIHIGARRSLGLSTAQ